MNSTITTTTTTSTTSPWPHLQSDILATIANLLCPYVGHLRLRSICHQWRASLPLSAASPPLSLLPVTTYLFSDPTSSSSFLLTLRHLTFSLLTPAPTLKFPLNLLQYGFTRIHTSLVSSSPSLFKKFALATDFVAKGDTVVLALTQVGALFMFNSAAGLGWVEIGVKGRSYDDIIFHNGRFYGTADGKGRLVVIDCTLRVVDVVPRLNYGCGMWTRLVGCHDGLYLVDQVEQSELGLWSGFEVFKLDDKGRFWDYEVDLGDKVFFLREEGCFSLSRRDYDGVVKNVIFVDDENVWDVKRGVLIKLVDSEDCRKLCWPPQSWIDGTELL